MTNTVTECVKEALPSQRTKRKSETRKSKSRVRRRNSINEPVTSLTAEPATTTTKIAAASSECSSEIDIAVYFFLSLLQKQQIQEAIVWENFSNRLSEELRSKFEGHWYPEQPDKGSGYRCIRVNSVTPDLLVQRVAVECGIESIRQCLPTELTVWIDPGEVSYRIGEEGSICRHYHAEITPSHQDIPKMLARPRSHSDDFNQ